MDGIRLDTSRPFWELSGRTDFPSVLSALASLLPEGCVLYFEDGSPTGELAHFLRACAVPKGAHIAPGTIWPRPSVVHVPASSETLNRLAKLMLSRVSPELAIHFHVYRAQTVLLEWYDAFYQPMRLDGTFSEDRVRLFAERLRMSFQRQSGQAEPSAVTHEGA